jgi:hypothetical protein
MSSLGSHGLPQRSYGSFAGKFSFTKEIGDNLPGRLGPHGLGLSTFASAANVELTLDGATVAAQAGNPVVFEPSGVRQFAPHGLLVREREILPKALFNVTVDLVGAAINAQAEELEGASVTITLDGAVSFALPGSVAFFTPAPPEYRIRYITAEVQQQHTGIVVQPRDMNYEQVSQSTLLGAKDRSTLIEVRTVSIEIQVLPLGVNVQ